MAYDKINFYCNEKNNQIYCYIILYCDISWPKISETERAFVDSHTWFGQINARYGLTLIKSFTVWTVLVAY